MTEIWKDIDGFNGVYQVSNLGRVKSVERIRKGKSGSNVYVPEKILKCKNDKDGYKECALCVGTHKKQKSYRVHRLVAEAFLPNPNNYLIINHINEIKDDNRVENLEWCTNEYNCRYSLAKPIIQFSINNDFIQKWDCIADIKNNLNIDGSTISKCCKNTPHHKTAKGFKWGYADDYEKIPFNVFNLEIYKKKVG